MKRWICYHDRERNIWGLYEGSKLILKGTFEEVCAAR